MATLLETRVKNEAIAEVEGQGLYVQDVITQTLRNAASIVSPTTGNTSNTTLSVNTYTPVLNPTVFSLTSGAMQITEGGGGAVLLTNPNVTMSNLTFSNLSRANTPGVVRIQFTLTYNNTVGRNEYNYARVFTSSASLRQP